jgi:tetratricopeptide (TPR) repeat protein
MTDSVEDTVSLLRDVVATSPAAEACSALAVLLLRLASDLATTGRLQEALAHADEAAVILHDLPDDVRTGLSRPQRSSCLSTALQVRYEVTGESKSLDEAIIVSRRGLSGIAKSDPDLSTYLSNLGNLHRLRYERFWAHEDLDEAVALQRDAVAAAPDDDTDRTALLSNLGTALRLRFETSGDVDTLDEAVAALRQAAAATHVEHTSWVRRQSNLGAALRARYSRLADASDLTEAESILRRAAESAPEDSTDTYAVLANLGNVLLDLFNVLRDERKLTDAASIFEHVLIDRLRVLGADHPDTLAARNNLANTYAQQGRLSEAETIYRSTLTDLQRILGPDHPDTLAARSNLANTCIQQGRLSEAETIYRSTLTDLQRILGPDHPDTLVTHNNLANTCIQQGRLSEAETAYRSILAVQHRTLGDDHPGTLHTRTLWTGVCDMLAKRRHDPLVTRMMVMVDIATFGAVPDGAQLVLREQAYLAMKNAFMHARVAWDKCAVEDHGDGALILLPPRTPGNLLVDLMPDTLLSEIHAVNEALPQTGRLRLRLAMHTGEVHVGTHGMAGDAIVEVFRMIDSDPLRQALREHSATLAVMVSDSLFQTAGKVALPGRLTVYRQTYVQMDTTRLSSWIRQPPLELPAVRMKAPSSPSSWMDSDSLFRLTDALLLVPVCRDDIGRKRLLDRLAPEISQSVTRHPRARQDMHSILLTCIGHENGLDELIRAVVALDTHSLPLRQLVITLARIRSGKGNDGTTVTR